MMFKWSDNVFVTRIMAKTEANQLKIIHLIAWLHVKDLLNIIDFSYSSTLYQEDAQI